MFKKYFVSSLCNGNCYKSCLHLSLNLKTPRKNFTIDRSCTTAAPELKSASIVKNIINKKALESYFYQYLLKKPEYSTSVFSVNCLYSVNDNDPESLKLLKRVINETSKETVLQDELLRNFESDINDFNVEEICKAIYFLSNLNDLGHKTLFKSLSAVLKNQLELRKFPRDEYLKLLFVIQTTWRLHYDYISYLKKKICTKLFNKIHLLSPQQVVVLFYCMNRSSSMREKSYSVCAHINNNITKFDLDELGIIAYRLKKIVYSHIELEASLMKEVFKNIDIIHPLSLYAVTETLRKFLKHSNVQQLMDFQEEIIPHLSKFDLTLIMNLVLIGDKHKALNLSLWEYLRKILGEKIQDLKVSDISRILYILVNFNICDEEFLNLIVENLEAKEIPVEDYTDLLSSLSHLTHFRLFPKNLLDMILTENFAVTLSKKNIRRTLKYHFWYLNYCVELEKPEYLYNVFDSSVRKSFSQYAIKRSKSQRTDSHYAFVNEVHHTLINIFGENTVLKAHCLPYSKLGCVMKFDKNFEAQPIPEGFKLSQKVGITEPMKDGHFWICITFCTCSDFIWNSETLILPLQTHIRHLKLNGFEQVVVKKNVFINQLQMENEKTYLKELIHESLKHVKSEKKN